MGSGLVIWISGLAGSGKSTISKELYNIIKQEIPNVVYLDGDGFREIFSSNKFDKDSIILPECFVPNFITVFFRIVYTI